MQYLKSAVQYYKDINPATLTGAIDVIVVERPAESGVEGEVELACSPFHVRFGKLSVLRPIDKKVRITVNDDEIPFYMKVGETGEAFFVFETDGEVPEDLQTSPLTSPVSNELADEEAPGEPDFLDLGASETAGGLEPESPASDDESSPNSSRYASMASTQVSSPIARRRSLPPAPGLTASTPIELPAVEAEEEADAPEADEDGIETVSNTSRLKSALFVPSVVSSAVEKVAGIGGAAMQGVAKHGFRDAKLKDAVRHSNHGSPTPSIALDKNGDNAVKGEEGLRGQSNVEDEQELGQLEKSMREKLEGVTLEGEGRPEPGDEVRIAARKRDKDVRTVLGGREGLGRATAHNGESGETEFSLRKASTGLHSAEEPVFDELPLPNIPQTPALEQSGDLMLDMSGYKIDEDSDDTGTNNLARDTALDEKAQEEVIAFTQGLLSSTDPKTLRNFFDPSDERSNTPSRAASPEPFDLDTEVPPRTRPTHNSTRSRAHSRASSPSRALSISSLQSLHAESEEPAPTDGVFHASPKQFTLKIRGKLHVFELSLCGSDTFGSDKTKDDAAFLEHQVTFSQFMEQDAVTDHNDLVVKYGDRYLTWDNASPVLASLAVYRKSLVDHPEHHQRRVDEAEAKRSGRGWGSWWSRKGAPSADEASTDSLPATDTSPPTSPPISPPDSPKSLPILDASPPHSPERVAADGKELDTKHYAKTLRLTSDQLKLLGLKKGTNVISFSVRSSYSGYATCTSRIFLWESDFSVVISDIDGTITKSDALGHVFTMIGRDWTHLGVAKLYTDIARNGYKMMYLTSRAIGQADTTREYLKGITQNGFKLPEGPVIMSPDRLMTSLHREVVLRKPEVFKMACLRDIQRLFHERSPFYAGFGNRITDALSYRSVDVPSSRIFTIDTNGEVKMELLELAGYKSSYIHMTDLVDQMFPPINRKTAPDFTDFNFWRAPPPQFDIPDLSPPSPALSARSDSSRLAFPRLGSIASSLSRRSSKQTLVDGPPTGPAAAAAAPNRTTRAGTPSSPLLQATLVEERNGFDDEEYDGRSESESMPGSLPNDNDFERLRAAALARNRGTTEAEEYKEEVKRTVLDGDEEDDDEEEEEEEGDDLDQMDFSSVPYL